MDKRIIISERELGSGSMSVTWLMGKWDEWLNEEYYIKRCEWIGKRVTDDGHPFNIVTGSDLPPDYDNYTWDFSSPDGYGTGSYTSSFNEILNE